MILACKRFLFLWLGGGLLVAMAADPRPGQPTFHSGIAPALEAAAADRGLVLIDFTASWCPPCQALKERTFAAKEFLENAGALAIAQVDVDADEKTPRAYDVSALPTLVLITTDAKIIARRTGFMDPAQLLAWLTEGRQRVKRGEWEGTAPGEGLEAFARKAAGTGLDTNDVTQLVSMLGDRDPTRRGGVSRLLLSRREQAVTPLIEALVDPYLGVRLGATELLASLAPSAPGVASLDAWQSPATLAPAQASLRSWWASSGKLPPATPRPADPSILNSVQAALEQLRGDDAVSRTEAMSTLVGHGAAALPAVREALKRYERTHPRLLPLLEDVRWAILVPDELDRRAGGVRPVLARGTSPERQSATQRLGQTGADALLVLSELAADADPLVVETAVRELAGVGGKGAVPAMATLLGSADANLRMTAAQALGRTRNAQVSAHLLPVLQDPNEVVACTALAALEELHGKESPFNPAPGAKEPLAPEMITALGGALSDPRWRVRATAAQVAGKLKATDLVTNLNARLDDADGFVVKNTLVALSGMSALPDASKLARLARTHASLRNEAIAMMVRQGTPEAVKEVEGLYDAAGTATDRSAILLALGQRTRYESRTLDQSWRPLLQKGLQGDPKLRRAVASLLLGSSGELAAGLVDPLLLDPDPSVRKDAAAVVLRVLAIQNGVKARSFHASDPDEASFDFRLPGQTRNATNQTLVTADRLATWHQALGRDAASNAITAAAAYVTGDGRARLPELTNALRNLDAKTVRALGASGAMALLMSKLPWPDAQPILDRLVSWPWLFFVAAAEQRRAAKPVGEYLLEPARFRAVFDRVSAEEIVAVTPLLLGEGYGDNESWSLLTATKPNIALAAALLEATNGAARAAGLYATVRHDANAALPALVKALGDSDPWVRATAVQGVAGSRTAASNRTNLEARLGPMLADPHPWVRGVAASGLLESEVRSAAGWDMEDRAFRYGEAMAYASYSSSGEEEPLVPLDSKPPYLAPVRAGLLTTNRTVDMRFALLLAQHGDFQGIEKLTAEEPKGGGRKSMEEGSLPDPVLTGIALSRDPKFIPYLRRLSAGLSSEWELRKVLRALKGMSGPDARALRLEVNQRMRRAGPG